MMSSEVFDLALCLFLIGAVDVGAQWYVSRHPALRHRVRRLRKAFRDHPFSVFACRSFAVVSDGRKEDVSARIETLLPRIVAKLEAIGVRKPPLPSPDICIFKEWKNYQLCSEWAAGRKRLWTGGNFFPHRNVIVADISEGYGVVIHELVHAYVHRNMPYCPVWLNEGLANLFASHSDDSYDLWAFRDGPMRDTLAAFREHRALSVERLCSLPFNAFHIDDEARNYAQSTSLCLYLERKGLLKDFCDDFRKNHRKDPTGYCTIQRVLGRDDKSMEAFQRTWEVFLLASYKG